MELRNVGVAVDTRLDAGEGKVCVGFVSSTDTSQGRSDIHQRVDASIVNGKQYRVTEFRTSSRKAIRLCTFLTATEVYISVMRILIEKEAKCWKPIDRDTNCARGPEHVGIRTHIDNSTTH